MFAVYTCHHFHCKHCHYHSSAVFVVLTFFLYELHMCPCLHLICSDYINYIYRDSAQPVNVVTGLDYWLDNLMCNVPEVAMCYHHSGVVQVSSV